MFAALTDIAQAFAASVFGTGLDGAQMRAWFPSSLTDSPDTVAGYAVPLGPIVTGPVRISTRDPLQMVERAKDMVSISLSRSTWNNAFGADVLPEKGMTCFIIGPASADDESAPDAARCLRCTVEDEARASSGLIEIDCLKHPNFFA